VHAVLRDAGVDFDSVDYFVEPLSKERLRALVKKLSIPARNLLRTNEPRYKALRLGERDLSEDEIIALMVEHPDLMQRPIVEKGARAILARPAERIRELL
jgi:arsenate reductase